MLVEVKGSSSPYRPIFFGQLPTTPTAHRQLHSKSIPTGTQCLIWSFQSSPTPLGAAPGPPGAPRCSREWKRAAIRHIELFGDLVQPREGKADKAIVIYWVLTQCNLHLWIQLVAIEGRKGI